MQLSRWMENATTASVLCSKGIAAGVGCSRGWAWLLGDNKRRHEY